jgi:hypothetical protein
VPPPPRRRFTSISSPTAHNDSPATNRPNVLAGGGRGDDLGAAGSSLFAVSDFTVPRSASGSIAFRGRH